MFAVARFFGIKYAKGNRYIVEADAVIANAENSIHELYLREKYCDIKITDFIEENYKEEQLFYSPNHPNERLINEYVNRMIEYLGYKRRRFSIVDILVSDSK